MPATSRTVVKPASSASSQLRKIRAAVTAAGTSSPLYAEDAEMAVGVDQPRQHREAVDIDDVLLG